MLRVHVRSASIIDTQRGYREQGTLHHVETAHLIAQWHAALRHGSRRFGERQAAAQAKGASYLRDGCATTLRNALSGPVPSHGWPRGRLFWANSILHGLHLDGRVPMPEIPPRWGGATIRALDPDSYFVAFHDGPPQERTFGTLAGVAFYCHPFRAPEIMWIGDENDIDAAFDDLNDQSGDLADWAIVHPEYNRWLREQG